MPSRDTKWPLFSLACPPGTRSGRSSLFGLQAFRLSLLVDVPECRLPGSAVAQTLESSATAVSCSQHRDLVHLLCGAGTRYARHLQGLLLL